MKKEFVCTIDHTKFNTEEALVKHLLTYYSMKQEPGENSSDILKKTQEAFPEAHIEVVYNPLRENSVPYVEIIIPNCGAMFSFYIDDDTSKVHGVVVFKTVEEAIDHYEGMLNEKDKLVQAVMDKFKTEKVVVSQVHQDGYGDDSDSITFSFMIDEKEHFGNYEFDGIDKCLRSLDGYFVSEVEGKCDTDYGRYNSTNTIYVDGVDLRDLAERAKKLKVEILEYK